MFIAPFAPETRSVSRSRGRSPNDLGRGRPRRRGRSPNDLVRGWPRRRGRSPGDVVGLSTIWGVANPGDEVSLPTDVVGLHDYYWYRGKRLAAPLFILIL